MLYMNRTASLFIAAITALLCQCTQTRHVQPPPNPGSYLPAEMCYLDEVAPGIRVELRYAGNDNFVGRPICGYQGTRAILRKDAAKNLAKAAAILQKEGLGLLVYDAYRPSCAMSDFYRWSKTSDDRMKAQYYPNITKQGIYDGKYIGKKSEHSWGIAVDITLVDLKSGTPLDMGGSFDLLDASSATRYPHLTAEQRANRLKLRDTMAAVGMRNYSKEWWHYFVSPPGLCHTYSFPVKDDYLPAPQAK